MNIELLKARANTLKQHTLMVYFAAKNPEMPVLVRLLALVVAAYAFSPIDLIPDFIPIIGLLDDIVLIPLGVALVVRLTPPEIIESARIQAQHAATKPINYPAALVIVTIWLAIIWISISWLSSFFDLVQ